jgi:hypothetical protein
MKIQELEKLFSNLYNIFEGKLISLQKLNELKLDIQNIDETLKKFPGNKINCSLLSYRKTEELYLVKYSLLLINKELIELSISDNKVNKKYFDSTYNFINSRKQELILNGKIKEERFPLFTYEYLKSIDKFIRKETIIYLDRIINILSLSSSQNWINFRKKKLSKQETIEKTIKLLEDKKQTITEKHIKSIALLDTQISYFKSLTKEVQTKSK